MFKRGLLIILTIVGLSAIASVSVADRDDSNPPGSDVPQVAAIESDAKDALSVLETSRDTLDSMASDVEAKIDEYADFGMNPHLSRLLIANTTNSLYVIPARDHVCASLTIGQGAAFSCPATDDLAQGKAGAATATVEGGGIAIYGLVPDGVESISIQTDATTSTEIATEKNGYYTVLPAGTPVRTVRYVGPSGPVEYPIADPAVAFEEP